MSQSFDFVPKIVFLMPTGQVSSTGYKTAVGATIVPYKSSYTVTGSACMPGGGINNQYLYAPLYVKLVGNKVSWYSSTDAVAQVNTNVWGTSEGVPGYVRYIAIG